VATSRTPVSAPSVLAGANLSWSVFDGCHPRIGSGYAVEVTHRDERDGQLNYSLAVLDLDENFVEDCTVISGVNLSATAERELCGDVERALQSGVGVIYRDLKLVAA
jgi:hypothetical protein